jgi:hypothetical protein
MGLRRAGLRVEFTRVLLVPVVAASLAAQGTADADKAIGNLRLISKELIEAINRLEKHLDDAAAGYDRGYRAGDGQQVQGADVDFATTPTGIGAAATRKFVMARMLAARDSGRKPIPVDDAQRIEDLIAQAGEVLDSSDALLSRLLVVSVRDLDSRKQREWEAKHDQLLKARAATEDTTKKALLALPIDLPEVMSARPKKDQAWNLGVMGNSMPPGWGAEVRHDTSRETPLPSARNLPLRWEPFKRITLIHDVDYRMALTDSGTEDRQGRHIFYQEEWLQRGALVLRMRWRVGVDLKTGQHVLIKRYRTRQFRGEMDDLYNASRDQLWYLEPSGESEEPSRQETESALEQVAHSREQIRAAVSNFKNTIRTARIQSENTLDAGLPDELREILFAIRGHMAGAAAVLEAEERVWDALRECTASIRKLEPLGAWANQATPDQDAFAALSAAEWQRLQERLEDEIDLTRTATEAARAALPPRTPEATANFGALQKDLVVHIYRPLHAKDASGPIRFLQEIWRLDTRGLARQVRRTSALIAIDSKTGRQTLVDSATTMYKANPGESVEAIYEQYGGQDAPLRAQLH